MGTHAQKIMRRLSIVLLLLVFTLPDFGSPSTAERSTLTPPLSIAILPADTHLPSNLVALLDRYLTYAPADLRGNFNALLVSGPMLTRLLARKEGARRIHALLSGGKILLVLHRSTTDLREQLHPRIPTMHPQTTRYLVSSVTEVNPGIYISGGILLHKDRTYTPEEKAKDIVEFTVRVRSLRLRVARLQNNTPYWAPVNTLFHYLDQCPFGKYNETVYAERAMNHALRSYDFWNAKIEQQTMGGYSACNSSYQTSRLWTRADMGLYWGQLPIVMGLRQRTRTLRLSLM